MKNTPIVTGKLGLFGTTPLLSEMPGSNFPKQVAKIVAFIAAMALTTTMVKAEHIWQDPGGWAGGMVTCGSTDVPLFSAHELTLDLGASYSAAQGGIAHVLETNIKGSRGTWGGDVGLNYFLTRNIGVGVDANMPDNGGNLVDSVLGNLTLRLPLGTSAFAPYMIGGGGRTTDDTWQWAGHAGVGIEFRPSHNIGFFTDARYVWPRHSSDALMLRAGIRLVL